MRKLKLAIGGAFASLALLATQASAAPSSTPEEVVDSILGETIDTAVDLSIYMIQNYLGYIIALGIVIGGYFLFKRFGHIGSR